MRLEDNNFSKESLSNPFDDEDFGVPEQSGNSIYFYCKVSTTSICALNKQLRDLDKKNYMEAVSKQNRYNNTLNVEPIMLYIQSPGGDVFASFSGMDTILQCRTPVYTVVEGIAASGATFLSVAGSKRFITPNSHMLIHQLSSGTWGQYEKMKEEVENLDNLMAKIKKVYLNYTLIPEKELSEILKKDIYFDAEKCLKLGLVDSIK
jgi:ATP-dependent Clp protease protease subunit